MQEIENHIVYELLKTKYNRIALDYVIMSVDTEYEGEITHKNAIIEALFPNKSHCEVYRWNDEFSNYFDAGKEWWGTGLWSVYDYFDRTMVIIGASLTD